MKNKILVLLLLSGTIGCVGLAFDNLEFDRLINIKILADQAVTECGTDKVKGSIDKLSDLVAHQFVYASNRSSRGQVGIATTELTSLVANLQQRYKLTPPSVTYCQEKLKNISAGTTTIIQTLGNM